MCRKAFSADDADGYAPPMFDGQSDVSGLLERESELGAVGAALDRLGQAVRAPSVRERLLIVTGPAGLGKTSLLNAVRTGAAARGLRVLEARGGEQEQGLAFRVMRGLLRPALMELDEAERERLLGGWREIVGPAVGIPAVDAPAVGAPTSAAVDGVASDGPSDAPPGGPSGGAAAEPGAEPPAPFVPPDPQGVQDGLDWVVTSLAMNHGPLVLVVDDCHWADAQSLAWIGSYASRLADVPILLVLAYRPDEVPSTAREFLAIPQENGVRPLKLAPLTPEAVAEVVRRFYADGGARVEEAFGREVWAVTGGNPFETVELVAKARDQGLAPAEAAWPRLRELADDTSGNGLIARVKRLGSAAEQLSWAVAVLGIGTPLKLAAQVATLDPAGAETAAERLRVERVLTGGQVLEFIHPLVATAVYRSIPEELRSELHEAAAWALTDLGRSPTDAARHWLEVPPSGKSAVVEQLRLAAAQFMRAGAPAAAQRCLRRAVAEPPEPHVRAEVQLALATSTLLYDPAATVTELRAALADPELTETQREDATVLLVQSLAHSDRLEEAAELVTAEVARAADPRSRLRLEVWHYMWRAFDANESGSQERSRRLADLAELLERETLDGAVGDVGAADADDPGGTAGEPGAASRRLPGLEASEPGPSTAERYIWGLRAWDATVRGESAETAVHFADLALQGSGLSWADPEWGFEVPVLTSLVHMYADRPDRAEELFAEGIAEYERAGWRGAHLAFAHTILGYIRYRCGDLEQAERSARRGLDLADRVGERLPVHWYAVGTLIAVLMARGSVDEASALAERHRFRAPFSHAVVFPDSQTVLGALLWTRGELAEAERELTAVGAHLDERGMCSPAWSPWRRVLAAVLVDQARAAGAAGAGEAAEPVASAEPVEPAEPADAAAELWARARRVAEEGLARAECVGTASARGSALHALAETWLQGDPRRAELLAAAVALLDAAPAPYELTRALLALGQELAAGGDPDASRSPLRRALVLAGRISARPLQAAAAAALERLGHPGQDGQAGQPS